MKTALGYWGLVAVMIWGAVVGCSKKEEPAGASGTQTVQTVTAQAEEQIEQKTCPVMEGPINPEIFVEYQGKKVYFCCPSCKDEFQKAPEKYLSKLPQFQK
jgi:YHS domain-containing protein